MGRKRQPGATDRRINPRRLRRILEQNFEVIKERSNDLEVTIICEEPSCPDRSGNCSINLKTGAVHCWRCNMGTHIIPFLRKNGVEVEDESLEEIVSAGETSLDEFEQSINGQDEKAIVTPVELPEGFTRLDSVPDSIYTRMIGQMAQRKNLYLQDLAEAGAGFTRVGDWEPFCIFPVYELGKLVYYQGRTYAPRFEGNVTKKFPSKKDVPLGAGNWVYGYDRSVKAGVQVLIVVESILNVLSLRWELQCQGIEGVEPVAVFKHHISATQHIKLLASTASEICLMYDADSTADAWKEAESLGGNRIATVAAMPYQCRKCKATHPVQIVCPTCRETMKSIDANDDAKLALEMFRQRRQFSPANALLDSLGL